MPIVIYLIGYLAAYILLRKTLFDDHDEGVIAAAGALFSWMMVIIAIVCLLLWCIFKPLSIGLDFIIRHDR
ncbi:MAG: hypothetical protein ACTSSP_11505 [Candidatus Asgardarchaeia archaeon]